MFQQDSKPSYLMISVRRISHSNSSIDNEKEVGLLPLIFIMVQALTTAQTLNRDAISSNLLAVNFTSSLASCASFAVFIVFSIVLRILDIF